MWDEKKKKGVLGDFDLANVRDNPRDRNGERTGTVPFMPLDLLCQAYYEGKIVRIYRHDVESFIWVLVWVSMIQNCSWEGRKSWQTSDYNSCRGVKGEFLTISSLHVSPSDAEKPRWALAAQLLAWLRPFYTSLTPPTEANSVIFAQVMAQIEENWVWGEPSTV